MSLNIRPCQTVASGGTAHTQKNCIYDDVAGTEEEIISMQSGGPYGSQIYCTKSPASFPGTAYGQRCYTRNAQGELYSTSGTGLMPTTIGGPAVHGQAVTSADPQDIEYLEDIAPGSRSRKKYQEYIGGWWMNIFGLRKAGLTTSEESPTEVDYRKVAGATLVGGVAAISLMKWWATR